MKVRAPHTQVQGLCPHAQERVWNVEGAGKGLSEQVTSSPGLIKGLLVWLQMLKGLD